MQLVFFIDGLKYNLIKYHMPFLNSMNKRRLISDFGYSCTCHPTIYTGVRPEQHGSWFIWERSESSPYSFTQFLPGKTYDNLVFRKLINNIANRKVRNEHLLHIPPLRNLPLKYWGEFDLAIKKLWNEEDALYPYKTLFDILRENDIPHKIIGVNENTNTFNRMVSTDIDEDTFYFFFIREVDHYLHQYGDRNPIVHNLLNRLDKEMEKKYLKALQINPNTDFICFSDHGHVNVEETLDIHSFFKSLNDDINNYIHLIESTFLRVWVRNDKEYIQINRIFGELENKGYGFVVDEEIKKKYYLNFKHNRYGDLIFHVKVPRILANSIWDSGRTIKSMHGYTPELEEHHGVFACNLSLKGNGEMELIDVLPNILEVVGLRVRV